MTVVDRALRPSWMLPELAAEYFGRTTGEAAAPGVPPEDL